MGGQTEAVRGVPEFEMASALTGATPEPKETPVAAQAHALTMTAFDGTYFGVSRTLEGTMWATPNQTRGCVPNGQPGPLTIVGGLPRYNGSTCR
jgi:hypothetical protein